MNTCPSQNTRAARLYGDIIGQSRPDSPDSRMPVADRAKIFAPVGALTGFEKVIEAENAKASTP